MAFQSKRMTHVDGKMHHLGIDEHDIAKTVLLSANMEDVRDMARLLDRSEQTGLYREYLTITGEKEGIPLSTMSTGNGCMPMAIAVEELNHIGAKTLIKVGTGIAIQPGVEPGTLIVPSGAMRGEGATLEYVNYQYPAVADLSLLGFLMEEAAKLRETPIVGIARSHDSYYLESAYSVDGGDRINKLRKMGIELIEHEVSSLFVLSSILKLRAAAIYVVEENLTDGTTLDETEIKSRLDICYEIAVRTGMRVSRNDGK